MPIQFYFTLSFSITLLSILLSIRKQAKQNESLIDIVIEIVIDIVKKKTSNRHFNSFFPDVYWILLYIILHIILIRLLFYIKNLIYNKINYKVFLSRLSNETRVRQKYTALRSFHDVTSSDYQQRFNPGTCTLAYLKVKVHFKESMLESIKRYLFPTESSFAEHKCHGRLYGVYRQIWKSCLHDSRRSAQSIPFGRDSKSSSLV